MKDELKKILIGEDQIKDKIAELAGMISADYKGKNPLFIGVLKGSAVFMADLIRAVQIPLEIDFMSVSSYGDGTVSSGVVKIIKDLDIDITARDMLIVEDILDTGLTLDYLVRTLEERKPNSIKICSLLIKNKEEQLKVKVDYAGFRIEDEFVVGYGLDYKGFYRNLPYIAVLNESVYSNPQT